MKFGATLLRFLRSGAAILAVFSSIATGCSLEADEDSARPPNEDSARPPNLVVVLSDQHSYDAVGYAGFDDAVDTPTLDLLASQGVWFNHAVSNAPVCTPFRGMLLTGQHPLYNGAFENDLGVMHDIGPTFADVLTTANYETGYVGKWHLQGGVRERGVPAGPARLGFGDPFYTNNVSTNFTEGYYYDPDTLERVDFGEWVSTGQTRQALDFLESRRGTKLPFAMFVSWHPPHNHNHGYQAPAMWHEIYDPDELSVRQFGRDPSKQETFRDYLSMVSLLDDHVRKIVEKLESMGVADNTLVVFTSDHGDHFGWIGRNGHKQSPEDVSVRVPLLMHWPNGLGQFGKSELIVGALDLMPTILGLLDLPVPETCVGKNLSNAILKGDDDAVDSAPLFLFGPAWRGVYTREFTYSTQNYDYATEANRVVGGDLGPRSYDTLYDRLQDPWCETNLYDDPAYSQVQADLHARTLEWLAYFRDPFVDHSTLVDLLIEPGHSSATNSFFEPAEVTFTQRPIDTLHAAGYTEYVE